MAMAPPDPPSPMTTEMVGTLSARQAEVERAMAEWTERQLAPSIRHLRELYRATLGESVTPEEAERLAHKFAHVPVKGLRAIARTYGLEAARLFLAETGLAE